MKSTIAFASVALLSLSLLSSCKSNSTSASDTNSTGVASGVMTATINNAPWVGQAGGYRHAGVLNNAQFEGFIIPTDQIAISLSPDINSVGSFPLTDATPSGNFVWIHYLNAKETYGRVLSGSITITALTATNVQGTFDVMIKSDGRGDTARITNGKFNAPLS